MSRLNAKNESKTSLYASMNNTQTNMVVASATALPSPPFMLSVENEIVRVTAINGTELTIQRAQEGTTASAHASGVTVENRFTAGTMGELVSENDDISYPAERTMYGLESIPTDAKKGVIRGRIEGMTAQNLITNGNFANGTTGWTTSTATLTASNNVLTSTGNGTVAGCIATHTSSYPVLAGKKIYFRATVRITNTVCTSLTLRMIGSTGGTLTTLVTQSSPEQNRWYTLSGILTTPADFAGFYRFMPYHNYPDATTATGQAMEVKEAIAIDLTSMFGAGSELDTASCDRTFVTWFDGLKFSTPVRVRATERNLLNHRSGNNKVFINSGAMSVSFIPDGIKLKSTTTGTYHSYYLYFQLKPNTTYTLRRDIRSITAGTNTYNGRVFVYETSNATTSIASITTVATQCTFTSPADGLVSVRFVCTWSDSELCEFDFYNICMVEGTVTGLAYEPYAESTAVLDNGGLLRRHQTLTDSMDVNGSFVKRVGIKSIQASDVTAIYTAGVNVDMAYIMQPTDSFPFTTGGNQATLLGSNKVLYSDWDNASNVGCHYLNSNGRVYYILTKGTTLAQAQALLIGMTLLYQLAVPVVTTYPAQQLTCDPKSTLFIEPYVKVSQKVTGGKITVIKAIKSLDYVNKISMDTGLSTVVPLTNCTIATDGLSLTITGSVDAEYYEVGYFIAGDAPLPVFKYTYPANMKSALSDTVKAVREMDDRMDRVSDIARNSASTLVNQLDNQKMSTPADTNGIITAMPSTVVKGQFNLTAKGNRIRNIVADIGNFEVEGTNGFAVGWRSPRSLTDTTRALVSDCVFGSKAQEFTYTRPVGGTASMVYITEKSFNANNCGFAVGDVLYVSCYIKRGNSFNSVNKNALLSVDRRDASDAYVNETTISNVESKCYYNLHSGLYTTQIEYPNIRFSVIGTTTAEGQTIHFFVDGFSVINLTKSFGAGKEPTKDWCDKNLHFVDGLKYTQPFRVKSTGKRTPRAYLLLGFDDGYDSDFLITSQEMLRRGMKGTSFIPAGTMGIAGKMTWSQVQQLYALGWDCQGHTNNHVNCSTLTADEIRAEFIGCANNFIANGLPAPKHLTFPFFAMGTYGKDVGKEFYLTARISGDKLNFIDTIDLNAYNCWSSDMQTTAHLDFNKGLVDQAIAQNGILSIDMHKVIDTPSTEFETSRSLFTQFLDYVATKPIKVITASEMYKLVMDYRNGILSDTSTEAYVPVTLRKLVNPLDSSVSAEDTIDLNTGELRKEVSDKVTITSALSRWVTPVRHTNSTALHLQIDRNDTVHTSTTTTNHNADIYHKGVLFAPQSPWTVSNTIWNTPNQYSIESILRAGKMAIIMSLAHTDTGWADVPTLTQINDYLTANPITMYYHPSQPTFSRVKNIPQILAEPSGALTIEPYERGVTTYGTGITVNATRPISPENKLDVLYKITNGVKVAVDLTTVTYASNYQSFTIAGALASDMYEYGYIPSKHYAPVPVINYSYPTSIMASVVGNTSMIRGLHTQLMNLNDFTVATLISYDARMTAHSI